MSALTKIKGIGPALAAACAAKGFKTVAKIASASPEEFAVPPSGRRLKLNIIRGCPS